MTIAIVSTNKNQYSETFIHNHVKLLPATIHLLFDGYLPLQYSSDKGLTSHFFLAARKRKWFSFLIKRQPDHKEQLRRAIAQYLAEHKIKLIFCEYGPAGVEMMDIAEQLNIPLIVHFHGYDAYRQDVLADYGKLYKALFSTAAAVIGVSAHMCRQLRSLGCDPLKLHNLPYGIDQTVFYERAEEERNITFVACGRFVAKKAPQITIRAFAQVVKQLPDATLAMIGDGELLEECKQLVAELGISNAVTFMGALSQTAIAGVYSRSLVFVQHSITTPQGDSEGTPLAVLESAASGLPAVSTWHGGISDVVAEGETGFLVNERDLNGMAEKMILLARQPELAKRMGEVAAAYVQANHTLEAYTQRLWHMMQAGMEAYKS